MLAYCYLNLWEQTTMKFESNHNKVIGQKCIWKCRLLDAGHFLDPNVLTQIVHTLRSTSNIRRFGTFASDPCLIDVDPMVFVICINCMKCALKAYHFCQKRFLIGSSQLFKTLFKSFFLQFMQLKHVHLWLLRVKCSIFLLSPFGKKPQM